MKPSSTVEVIEAAFRVAQADPSAIMLDLPRRKVFRMNEKVIKFGPDVDIREATAMSFVAKSAITLPVPKVFSAETYEDGTTVIEMEMISGKTLQEVWPRLSNEEKSDFAQQLKEIVKELRSFKGAYIGSFEGGPASDVRRDSSRGGPFINETDFNAFLLGNVVSKTPNIYRRMLNHVMSDRHRIVLTHGDLSPCNIMVREGRIVGLLDWECAGWYPEYWEFVQFFRAIDCSLDWHDYADIIFTKLYPHELMTDHFLGRLTRH